MDILKAFSVISPRIHILYLVNSIQSGNQTYPHEMLSTLRLRMTVQFDLKNSRRMGQCMNLKNTFSKSNSVGSILNSDKRKICEIFVYLLFHRRGFLT